MTTLLAPTAGIPESHESDHARCGRDETNAILTTLLGEAVDCWAPDFATAEQIAESVTAMGRPKLRTEVIYPDTPSHVLQAHIQLGHYVIVGVCVDCNTCVPEPCPGCTNHWLAAYSDQGDCYNCWFGTYQNYGLPTLDQTHNPQMGFVIIWIEGLIPLANNQGGANDEEMYMAGNVIPVWVVDQNGNKVGEEVFQLDSATGDVYWKVLDATGKQVSNAKIGQNGSLNQGWSTGLRAQDGLTVKPTQGVVGTVVELLGMRVNDTRVWRCLHALGSSGFTTVILN